MRTSEIFTIVLAILTTIPVIVWYVNAYVQISRYYGRNEKVIKEGATKTLEQLKAEAKAIQEEAEKLKQTITSPSKPTNDDPTSSQPGTKSSR